MNKTSLMKAILLAIAVLVKPMASSAADVALPHVTVYGTATTEVTPDLMNWRLKVRNQEAGLEKVAQAHSASVKLILDYLKLQKLPKDSVQTSGMEFGENWVYKDRTKVKEGYLASTDISFKIIDLKKYKDLWIGISRLQNVSLTGVYYDHSKRIEYRNETRKKALLAAKKKAEALALALGSKIGKPLFIEEELIRYPVSGANFSNSITTEQGGAAAGNTSLAPGQIPLTMQVRVSFLLVTDDN